MTRDLLLELLRAHKLAPGKTRYLTSGKSVECVSGCRLLVPFGESVAAAIEEHQADMIGVEIDAVISEVANDVR